jgi:hypothetical protein
MNLRLTFCTLLCVVILARGGEPSRTLTREQRELRMADNSIMASLAVSRSPKGRYLFAENRVACLGGDKAELGLALIGARSTRASLAATGAILQRFTGNITHTARSVLQLFLFGLFFDFGPGIFQRYGPVKH